MLRLLLLSFIIVSLGCDKAPTSTAMAAQRNKKERTTSKRKITSQQRNMRQRLAKIENKLAQRSYKKRNEQ